MISRRFFVFIFLFCFVSITMGSSVFAEAMTRAWVGGSTLSGSQVDVQLEQRFGTVLSGVLRYRQGRLNSQSSEEVFLGLRRSSIANRLGMYYGGGVTLLSIHETGKIGGPYIEYGVTGRFSKSLFWQLGYSLDYAKRDAIQSIRTFYSFALGVQF